MWQTLFLKLYLKLGNQNNGKVIFIVYMKKEELVSIIRGVVREEVERTLPNVLVEILASKVAEQELVSERISAPVSRKAVSHQPQPTKKFSTNPILNQILNETQGGVPTDPETEMVSAEMSVPGAQVSILDKMKGISAEQLNENKEVAGVFNVLKRDFRQIVRAIDSKAKNVSVPPRIQFKPGDFDQQ